MQIIDIRVNEQYDKSYIGNAQNIPHSKIRESINKLDKDY
ncbi:rhodanese-like domain-containing protein [Clostridium sp. ZS2-4]